MLILILRKEPECCLAALATMPVRVRRNSGSILLFLRGGQGKQRTATGLAFMGIWPDMFSNQVHVEHDRNTAEVLGCGDGSRSAQGEHRMSVHTEERVTLATSSVLHHHVALI